MIDIIVFRNTSKKVQERLSNIPISPSILNLFSLQLDLIGFNTQFSGLILQFIQIFLFIELEKSPAFGSGFFRARRIIGSGTVSYRHCSQKCLHKLIILHCICMQSPCPPRYWFLECDLIDISSKPIVLFKTCVVWRIFLNYNTSHKFKSIYSVTDNINSGKFESYQDPLGIPNSKFSLQFLTIISSDLIKYYCQSSFSNKVIFLVIDCIYSKSSWK